MCRRSIHKSHSSFIAFLQFTFNFVTHRLSSPTEFLSVQFSHMDASHLFSRPRLNSSHRNSASGSSSSASGNLVLFEPPVLNSSRSPIYTLHHHPISSPLSLSSSAVTTLQRSVPARFSTQQSRQSLPRHRNSRMSNPPFPGQPGQSNPTTRTRGSSGRFESSVNASTRSCAKCGKTDTPQWRTGVDGSTLCNPCGIKQRRPSTGSRSPGESPTAAKKRQEVQRAAASIASSKKKKYPKTSPSSSQSGRSSSGQSQAGASHSPPRSTGDRARKKRKEAYELSNLLNPQ